MSISLMMAYYGTRENNRLELLAKTLESLPRDIELVIVDDCSPVPIDVRMLEEFKNHKLIRLENKTWVNPCIAMNTGLRACSGDIIIMQNPECYHVGNVVDYLRNRVIPGRYVSMSCRAMGRDGSMMWYNHPQHNPAGYFFCAGLHRANFTFFDEEFANAVGWDDDDHLMQLASQGVEIDIAPTQVGFVIHQYHSTNWLGPTNYKRFMSKWHKYIEGGGTFGAYHLLDHDVRDYNHRKYEGLRNARARYRK